jgi:hypothetical protein
MAEETPHHCQVPSLRRNRHPGLHQVLEVSQNVSLANLLDTDPFTAAPDELPREATEVGPVRRQGVRAQPALDAQMVEEALNASFDRVGLRHRTSVAPTVAPVNNFT